MATLYYNLKKPISYIHEDREEPDNGQVRLSLHTFAGHIGTLFVSEEDAPTLLIMFADKTYTPLYTDHKGFSEPFGELHPALQLISEYGELKTVEEIRKKCNAAT